jgi:serine/threonine protein kinase
MAALQKGRADESHPSLFCHPAPFSPATPSQVTGREIVREIKFTENPTRGRDIRSQILAASAQGSGNKLSEAEQKKALLLADLLDKLLVFDPARRLTAAAALKHAFITLVDLA